MGLGFSSKLFLDAGVRSPRSFAPSEDGAVAVEFAMILTVLLLIIVGIISFGWVFYQANNMETAAREAARRMSAQELLFVGTNVICADAAAQNPLHAEFVACDMLPNMSNLITVIATDLCTLAPPDQERTVSVEITADASDVAILDIFGFFTGTQMKAVVHMHREAIC